MWWHKYVWLTLPLYLASSGILIALGVAYLVTHWH